MRSAKRTATVVRRREAFTRQIAPMGLFEIGYVGLPCAVIGAVFLVLVGPKLLPNRTDMLEQLGDKRREYLVEMLVRPECPLIVWMSVRSASQQPRRSN